MAKLISVETALNIIGEAAQPLPTHRLSLQQAHGYVIAETLSAKVTLPPLNASAMDGYAMKIEARHAKGSRFKLIGEAPAGAPFQGKVATDECVRIFTGGAVPEGANYVIMQENVRADDTMITLTEPINSATHIRKAGIDFTKGAPILKRGTCLDAYALALLAAANHADVLVYKRPRIALIANGDELIEPGQDAGAGHVISSNPYGLAPLVRDWGGDPIFTGISKDEPATIKAHIEACTDADILLPIGGASVGDRDYMRSVFDELGYSPLFAKIAVKPGKPTWFGRLKAQHVLGLPGNPASALVCAHVFLKPLIYALTGRTDMPNATRTAILMQDLAANSWRTNYMRAHAEINAKGTVIVTPYPRQDSSLLSPFLSANCLLICPVDTPAQTTGDTVQILLIKPL